MSQTGPNSSSPPALLLCERTGRWAAALAGRLPAELRVRQTRWPSACALALAEAPTCVVALELSRANASDVLDLVGRWEAQYPLARVVVLASAELAGYETVVREAGAVLFVSSWRDVPALARSVERHQSRLPRARTNFATQVWNTLPWGAESGR